MMNPKLIADTVSKGKKKNYTMFTKNSPRFKGHESFKKTFSCVLNFPLFARLILRDDPP